MSPIVLPLRSFFIVLIFLFFLPLKIQAQVQLEDTLRKKIAYQPGWLKLNYYQKTLAGYSSRITADSFFLAQSGRVDPEAELQATINAFQTDKIIRDKQSAHCAYPARYQFLRAQLPLLIPEKKLPCKRLQTWMSEINAEGISLIYPGSYQNNPASMFGHTLLRLDQPGQDDDTRMLSYSVNYAAETGGAGGLLYAVNGLLGGFNGYFSIAPYYQMLKKYSDLESRDIWEYQLAFSPADVEFLLHHLWELRGVPFTYYYFDENCSYQLLALLEAVRPDLKLIDRFAIHVIPVDTVRAVLDQQGLLRATRFRPSAGSRVLLRAKSVSPVVQVQTKKYIAGDQDALTTLAPVDQAAALDLAYDLVEFKRLKNTADTSREEQQLLSILRRRSQLPVAEQKIPAVYPTKDTSPHAGHRTTRSRIEYRYEYDTSLLDVELRPAYHDTLDFAAGYTPGFGIDFLDVGLRIRERSGVQLKKIQVLQIESLTAQSLFFKPVSWKFSSGFERRYFSDADDSLQYMNRLAVGFSWNTPFGLLSLLPEVQNPIASHYPDGSDLFAGVYAGLIADTGAVALKIEGRSYTSLFNKSDLQHEISLPIRITHTTNTAFRITVSRVWYPELHYNSFGVSYDFFW